MCRLRLLLPTSCFFAYLCACLHAVSSACMPKSFGLNRHVPALHSGSQPRSTSGIILASLLGHWGFTGAARGWKSSMCDLRGDGSTYAGVLVHPVERCQPGAKAKAKANAKASENGEKHTVKYQNTVQTTNS